MLANALLGSNQTGLINLLYFHSKGAKNEPSIMSAKARICNLTITPPLNYWIRFLERDYALWSNIVSKYFKVKWSLLFCFHHPAVYYTVCDNWLWFSKNKQTVQPHLTLYIRLVLVFPLHWQLLKALPWLQLRIFLSLKNISVSSQQWSLQVVFLEVRRLMTLYYWDKTLQSLGHWSQLSIY